jgi:hypothetical protein
LTLRQADSSLNTEVSTINIAWCIHQLSVSLLTNNSTTRASGKRIYCTWCSGKRCILHHFLVKTFTKMTSGFCTIIFSLYSGLLSSTKFSKL